MHCALCPYSMAVLEAPKKTEATKIGAKPVALNEMVLSAKDLAVAANIATLKAVMKCIPGIVYEVTEKAENESSYREQGSSFLKEPIEIPFHCGTCEATWSCHIQIE